MNFLVRKPLFSLKRFRCDPKAVLLMSWILNLMILLGMDGMFMSKFVFMLVKLLQFNCESQAYYQHCNRGEIWYVFWRVWKEAIYMMACPLFQKRKIVFVFIFSNSMRKNNSQLGLSKGSNASKYGISKENPGSPIFGLNPNLNIEDEYIENLLKQIHFMNMEIKLLKEKQQQSEGNSLWGIVNRSNQPLVSNIVDSNQKYQTMKKQVDGDLNKTEYENIRLADQQNAAIRKLNYLEKRIALLQASKGESAANFKARQEKINEKIGEYQHKMKNLMGDKEEQGKKNHELTVQYETLLLEIEKEKFTASNEMGRIKNDEDIEEIIDAERTKEIQSLKDKITLMRQSIQSSLQFQRAKEDQASIRDNMSKIMKHIATSEFELMQLQASIKLAIEQKEKQLIDRKKLMQEFESLKIVLKELETLNASRLTQEVANRKRESVDIQKGELQSRKLEKNLEEIKKKLNRSEDSQKTLRQQVQHLERELQKLKDQRQQLNETLTKLVTANDKQDTTLTNCRNEYRRVQDQYQKILQAELTSSIDLNEIQTEIMFLRERKENLSEVLNLKEALNQTRLQDLQKVVQKNRDVNETVGLLMEKWEEIRNFSKI